jgi:Predicted hydrolase of the metallo-beta-lactamase superfamily
VFFHTGDWKLDPHPLQGDHYDDRRLLALGESGVEFVVGDSTNATVEGWSGSEAECHKALLEVIDKAAQSGCCDLFFIQHRAVGESW